MKQRLDRISALSLQLQVECEEAHASAPWDSSLARELHSIADAEVGIAHEIKHRLETAQSDGAEFAPDAVFDTYQQINDYRRNVA